jgi:hypothetical protein
MTLAVHIDETRWPRVYVTWPNAALADEDFERAVEKLSGFVARGEPYVVIHDARMAVRPSPSQRAFAAAHQERGAKEAALWLRGSAVVASNPLIAGVMRAINWIAPPTYPQRTFTSLEDAETWVDEQLR